MKEPQNNGNLVYLHVIHFHIYTSSDSNKSHATYNTIFRARVAKKPLETRYNTPRVCVYLCSMALALVLSKTLID